MRKADQISRNVRGIAKSKNIATPANLAAPLTRAIIGSILARCRDRATDDAVSRRSRKRPASVLTRAIDAQGETDAWRS